MKNSKKTDRHKTRPSDNISTEQTYTLEELKEAWNNPKPMTAEEIKNTFIEDDRPIDLSRLKI